MNRNTEVACLPLGKGVLLAPDLRTLSGGQAELLTSALVHHGDHNSCFFLEPLSYILHTHTHTDNNNLMCVRVHVHAHFCSLNCCSSDPFSRSCVLIHLHITSYAPLVCIAYDEMLEYWIKRSISNANALIRLSLQLPHMSFEEFAVKIPS